MNDIPFHLTVQGTRFFEGTLPALVAELARLNELLAKVVAEIEATKKE